MTLFPGFSAELIETRGTTINVLRKGTGRGLLLLHARAPDRVIADMRAG